VEEEKLERTGEPRFMWKMVVIRICKVGELKRIMNNNTTTPIPLFREYPGELVPER